MTEWRSLCEDRYRSHFIVLLTITLLWGGPLLAEGKAPSGAARTEGIPVTQIAPEAAQQFLTRLNLGIVSRLPRTNTLLITAEPGELQKAMAILELVDTRTEYDIRQLGPASMAATLPSNERIANAVGGISLGTFATPPRDRTRLRGIIDVHDGAVVAIAPTFQLPDIKLAVEMGPEVLKQRKALAKANDPAAIQQAIQATAMAEPAPTKPAGTAQDTRITGQPSGGSILPKEKPDEVREHARLDTGYHSLSQPELRPTPFLQAVDLPRGSGSPASKSSDANAADLRQVGAAPQDTQEEINEPMAVEPVAPQPPQAAPVVPQETARPQAAPQEAVQPDRATAKTPSLPAAKTAPTSIYEPSPFANGDQLVNLTLPERIPIIELLDLVGKYLNLSYSYFPDEVKGEVTLKLNGQLQGQMTVNGLYELLEGALKQNNLVAIRHKGNIVYITSVARAVEFDPMLMDAAGATINAGNMVVTRPFELKHIDTVSAQNLLTTMRLSIDVTPVAERQMLIVTAYAHRMERIERLLLIVDQPGRPRQFKYRQLRYTMAKTLAEKVKALAEQLENVSVTIGEPDIAGATARQPNETDVQYRTRLAQIRAAQAAQIRAQAAARGQMIPEAKPGVYLDADERTNRILMIGLEEQLEVVDGLVDALDVAQQDLRALKLYPMRHVDAEEVARKLQELGIISRLPETSASQRITGTPRTAAVVPGQPRPMTPTPMPEVAVATEITQEGLVGEPQVVVVESTNSLLVNATPEQHAQIVTIIEYVDSEMEQSEIPYKIYPLKNSSPDHLATILEGLIQETMEQERDGKIEKTVVRREERIQIVPDPNTYSLIVYASKKNQGWIASLVEQLDKRRPQVLIDVTLVEVTKTEGFNYALNVLKTFGDTSATGGEPNNIGKYVEWAGGALNAFYGDDQIRALLSTVQSKNYGRVLAKPKLLVNDNEPGVISTADITYVKKQSSIPVTAGTAGQQNTLIQTAVDYEEYEAGITLNITPHISEGELLRLVIELERSDFREKADPEGPPNKTTSNLGTAVTVPDGSTIILGGMVKLNQSKGGSGIPILSNIPIIGGLFRTINNSDIQSKLYIFVKAEIIRPADGVEEAMRDLENISDRNRTAFERHELEFQKYQSWPGIEPKPVNPPKVLDAQ